MKLCSALVSATKTSVSAAINSVYVAKTWVFSEFTCIFLEKGAKKMSGAASSFF